MTTNTTHNPAPAPAPAAAEQGAAGTERRIALAETFTPIATGVAAPFLADSASIAAGLVYGATAAFTAANYMNRLPPGLAEQLPAADILTAHRTTLGISTVTTGIALAMGTFNGAAGADAIMAGWLDPATIPGIVSLGWWAAVALVPYKLRRILHRPKTARTAGRARLDTRTKAPNIADQITQAWARHISDPDSGQHRHQVLANVLVYTDPANGSILRWTGLILAPAGSSVNVAKEAVSSVFKVNAAWVKITPGEHAGQAHISVNYKRPAELDPTTLAGAWAKYAARPGGLMAKTHLEKPTKDPNTGGEAAWVVADDDLDVLTTPNQLELAGALRTSPLLVSYEPLANNPRKAVVRMMKESPLERGFPFPGLDAMKATKGGRIPIGRTMSGHPSMLPIFDPVLGALHLVIAGTTGSGKGGAAQVVALGYHANNAAIIYGDPKGASNPAIPKMAAYSGLGDYGALGSLRISYALAQHRKAESAKYELKNFQPSKMRPWAPTILDEANKLLGPNVPNRKEAVYITGELTSQGRFIGMPFVLINQVVNLDQIGGQQAIRSNLVYGGSWLILRSDSGQTNLADLPDDFKGIDPADIPAVWKTGEDSLIYDPDIPEDDPLRTFGLGFLAAPGNRPGMQRIWTLEDATPHIDPDNIAIPEDFPDWTPSRLEEIANTPVPGFEEGDSEDDDAPVSKYTPGVDLPKKEPSAEDKVITILREYADPMHLEALAGADLQPGDYDIQYVDKNTLLTQTGLKETTLANTLGRLVRENRIHRQDGTRGMYGLGPEPTDTDGE